MEQRFQLRAALLNPLFLSGDALAVGQEQRIRKAGLRRQFGNVRQRIQREGMADRGTRNDEPGERLPRDQVTRFKFHGSETYPVAARNTMGYKPPQQRFVSSDLVSGSPHDIRGMLIRTTPS